MLTGWIHENDAVNILENDCILFKNELLVIEKSIFMLLGLQTSMIQLVMKDIIMVDSETQGKND